MIKNFFSRLRMGWKAMDTAEKIGTVLDVLCGVGGSSMGFILGGKMSEGRGRIERICIKTTALGLGIAGGDIACKTLREAYGEPAAALIDKMKEKNAEKEKEASANE